MPYQTGVRGIDQFVSLYTSPQSVPAFKVVENGSCAKDEFLHCSIVYIEMGKRSVFTLFWH